MSQALIAGPKNRNYPGMSLDDALAVARAIQDQAGGLEVNRVTLAGFLNRSPSSSGFVELVLASRAYGLTTGGKNTEEFGLTTLGSRATGDNPQDTIAAKRQAVLNVLPFKAFLEAYNLKKVPAVAAMKGFLASKAAVAEARAEECATIILANARDVGFIVNIKNGEYLDLSTAVSTAYSDSIGSDYDSLGDEELDFDNHDGVGEDQHRTGSSPLAGSPPSGAGSISRPDQPSKPKRVFIGHGKSAEPLKQLKATLDELGIASAVAVDEPNAGRPIGEKVASIMREDCSSAIFILSADERFFVEEEDGAMKEIWRPSQNAIYELGAAAVLYGKRIILFKEDKVTLPTDFRDLGHIPFSGDQIGAQWGQLLRELKALNMVEIVVTG